MEGSGCGAQGDVVDAGLVRRVSDVRIIKLNADCMTELGPAGQCGLIGQRSRLVGILCRFQHILQLLYCLTFRQRIGMDKAL